MPCGFCGIEGCLTKLTVADSAPNISSTCINHDVALDYQAASRGEANNTVCSNIPIHCSLCPLSPDGEPQTIWKYNALMHILVDHEQFDPKDQNLCILPDVPISMQARIHTSRAEEATLGIQEEHTLEAREDFNLLNSDDFPPEALPCRKSTKIYDGNVGKRSRADTQSTIHWITTPPSTKHHV